MHDVFYFTDVHGQLDLFQNMRDWCFKQDPECMIVFGGDACDRGEFGYDIMQAILDDPQIVYIRGNHEDLFLKAARDVIQQHPEVINTPHTIAEADEIIGKCRWLHNFELHMYNGGRPTMRAWLIDGAKTAFLERLENETCLTFALDNGVCFSHAGGTYEAWKDVYDDEHDGVNPDSWNAQQMIWDRSYLNAWWPKDKVIVFGHTPVCYIPEYVFKDDEIDEYHMKPYAYQPTDHEDGSGWHIGMDTGMTFYGQGFVLNCLTMNVIGFWDHDFKFKDRKRPVEIGFENFKII